MFDRFKPTNKKEGPMATTPTGQNAPNKPGDDTKNVGGKNETGKNEGGTLTDKDIKTGPDKLTSPSREESDKTADKVYRSEKTEDDGRVVKTSSINQEEADKVVVSADPINLTQSLTGVPGDVDLTQGGRLSGDRSLRVVRPIDEINEELEKTAGPNPAPNREGNEILKATQNLLATGFVANPIVIADTLKEILEKDRLDQSDREKLWGLEKQLRVVTRVA